MVFHVLRSCSRYPVLVLGVSAGKQHSQRPFLAPQTRRKFRTFTRLMFVLWSQAKRALRFVPWQISCPRYRGHSAYSQFIRSLGGMDQWWTVPLVLITQKKLDVQHSAPAFARPKGPVPIKYKPSPKRRRRSTFHLSPTYATCSCSQSCLSARSSNPKTRLKSGPTPSETLRNPPLSSYPDPYPIP